MTRSEYMHWTTTKSVELQDLACTRITPFNARRGDEPARLKVSHCIDPCNQVWFNKNRIAALPAEQQEHFNNTRIMYQTGKGVNYLVPVLVPKDTVPAFTKLADLTFRLRCEVLINDSKSAYTMNGKQILLTWNATQKLCHSIVNFESCTLACIRNAVLILL